jgi:hypothetical protein
MKSASEFVSELSKYSAEENGRPSAQNPTSWISQCRHLVIDDVCSPQFGQATKIAMPAPDSGAGIGRGASNDLGKV